MPSKKSTQSPTGAEFAALRAWLKAHGLPSDTHLLLAVGPSINGRSRRQIGVQLAAYLKIGTPK
jgi:hypothetical protein